MQQQLQTSYYIVKHLQFDNKRQFATHLTKAFDCLSHGLPIAKLNACSFNTSALRFGHSYFKNRMERTKVNSWPLLFDVFLCDIFLANYTDNHTPYTTGHLIDKVTQNLENAAKNLF